MLAELSLRRFKSWRSIDRMRLAPITGLFGPNSSGKTGVLQLLLVLKQTVESADRAQVLILGDERTPANLGTFRDLAHGHDEQGKLEWALRWLLPKPLAVEDPARAGKNLFESRDFAFESAIRMQNAQPAVESMSYSLGDARFSMKRKGSAGQKYQLQADGTDFRFHRKKGRQWDLPAPLKCYGFPDQVRAYFQNAQFLSDLQLKFEEIFAGTYYLGPLREYPKRQYTWAGAQPADMGLRGERFVDALLAARERKVMISLGKGKRRRTLEEHVAWWLRELGVVAKFAVQPVADDSNLYRVLVRNSERSEEVLITDVGFGVSQILPVIALCYYVPEGSTIILEQPEIHLHPSVQAGLADVFIDAVKRRRVQILFESHSEHLLRRLQRRVAEEGVPKDSVALYFCEMLDGRSELTGLRLDMFGNIENWPKDFFGDEFGEIAAMTLAAVARKKGKQ